MPRFFIDSLPVDGKAVVTGEDAHHMLKVLRMKAGESLILCDGQGHDYSCTFMQANGDTAECQVQEVLPSRGEPNVRVTLYMGLPKGDKMDFIVQKAVELGAVEIVPFLAERSVSRPDAKTLRKKCERWRKIAREAAMQCGRGCVPVVGEPLTQKQAAEQAAACDAPLFLYEDEREFGIRQALRGKQPRSVALMIGPEGGFAPAEAETAKQAGMQSVSLGPRILRCETAPLAALSVVMYETGNL